jgi:hypothetical protein
VLAATRHLRPGRPGIDPEQLDGTEDEEPVRLVELAERAFAADGEISIE